MPHELTVDKRRRNTILTAAFLLPVALFALLLAIEGLWPFSAVGPLGGDMVGQYLEFYAYMKDVFAGERDVFYSFSKTLGGDMAGIWAYYLLSPLNLIYLFVPYNSLNYAAMAVIAVKLGLCGLTAALFLGRKGGRSPAVLIFSTAYALMTWNILYFNNIMWLDGVYMLPVLLLTLERLVDGEGERAYTLALAYSLIVNYYIGWMLCIFLVLYFIWLFAVKKPGCRAFARFAFYSLLAGLLAAAVLLPTALALSGTKAGLNADVFELSPMFTLRELLEKLVCRAVPTGQVENDYILTLTPPLYCGALSTCFALVYFFNGAISRKRRVFTALGFLFMGLCHYLKGPYLIWHAFNYPGSFPYRFSFIFSLMLVICAWECWEHREGLTLRSFAGAALVLFIGLVILNPLSNPFISRKMLLMDMAVMAAGAAMLYLSKAEKRRGLTLTALLLMQAFTLLVNATGFIGPDENMAEYSASYDSISAEVEPVLRADSGFYRLGRRGELVNDPMRFGYDGLSHFCSTEKQQTKRFAINFGLRHFLEVWVSNSDGGTAGAEAFLGVKYIISDEAVRDYPKLESVGDSAVYLNPNALPLAFPVSEAVLGGELAERDIFLWQEQVWSAALGREAGIYSRQNAAGPELINLSTAPFKDGATNYSPIDPSQETGLIYRFTAQSDRALYIYTSEPLVEGEVKAELIVNGESLGPYMGSYNWRAVCLGRFEPGEEVEVRLRPMAGFFLQYETYFYYEDDEALALASAELQRAAEGGKLEKISDSHLLWQGSIAEDRLLMLTVPADKGWQLSVDGEEAEILRAYDTLIALRLEPGEHRVELRFVQPGLYPGLIISAAALALLTVMELKKRKKA